MGSSILGSIEAGLEGHQVHTRDNSWFAVKPAFAPRVVAFVDDSLKPLTVSTGLAVVLGDRRASILNLPRIEEQQSPYGFEGPAFEIWSRIDGSRSEDQIVDELVEIAGAERDIIARDTHEFIAQLLELGLIEEVAD